jgi:hypothetical protein
MTTAIGGGFLSFNKQMKITREQKEKIIGSGRKRLTVDKSHDNIAVKVAIREGL